MIVATHSQELDLSDEQVEFIKNLYEGQDLLLSECIEQFTAACVLSIINPNEILNLIGKRKSAKPVLIPLPTSFGPCEGVGDELAERMAAGETYEEIMKDIHDATVEYQYPTNIE